MQKLEKTLGLRSKKKNNQPETHYFIEMTLCLLCVVHGEYDISNVERIISLFKKKLLRVLIQKVSDSRRSVNDRHVQPTIYTWKLK